METLFRYHATPSPCGYLPDRLWSLEYAQVAGMTKAEYLALLLANWRRFGHMLFRPNCGDCTACRSIRVPVATFRPDRSQRRCRQANAEKVTLRIGEPAVSRAKLALYDRYHAFQTDNKDWPEHPAKDWDSYATSYVHQPFAVEEWCYYLDRRLIGVGYVDVLPSVGAVASGGRQPSDGERPDAEHPLEHQAADAPRSPGREFPIEHQGADAPRSPEGGLSAIYFFYDPAERRRALGTWNILSLIDEASRRGLPHVYLGYHVEGSKSMEYKARFRPNERRGDDGVWRVYEA